MERTLQLGEKSVVLKTHAAIPIQYRLFFKQDFFKDIFKLAKSMGETKTFDDLSESELDQIEFELFYRLFWLFAKAADPTIPPMEEWLMGFDILPIEKVMPIISDLLKGLLVQKSKKSRNPSNRKRRGDIKY